MSDSKSSYGEPVDEPQDVDPDVVSRAHEGLADAEAARREAALGAAPVAPDAASEPQTVVVEETVVEERVEADGVPWYERDDVPLDDDGPAAVPAAVPVVTPSEPVSSREPESSYASEPAHSGSADTERSTDPAYSSESSYSSEPAAAPVAPAAQPIFVQAPEAPRPRGNRGAAAAIGILAAVVFAVLYLAAWLGLELLYDGGITFAEVPDTALAALTTWSLWVPVVAFYLGFCLLGAFINRGGWGHWVVWGLIVGLIAYGGHLLGELFQAPFWMLTATQGAELFERELLAPLAIVAFVLGRELTIWFGAWVARRGKRVTELNNEAQREYERTLEAGPKLSHA